MGRGGGISSDADEIERMDPPVVLTVDLGDEPSATVKWSEIIMAEQVLVVVSPELNCILPLTQTLYRVILKGTR